MPFQPGHPGGPGRPKGSVSGRAKSLQTMDKMLLEEGNQELLGAAFQRAFTDKPLQFFL